LPELIFSSIFFKLSLAVAHRYVKRFSRLFQKLRDPNVGRLHNAACLNGLSHCTRPLLLIRRRGAFHDLKARGMNPCVVVVLRDILIIDDDERAGTDRQSFSQ
jgi:hypothetical protein